ncbi:uncharacterized protein LOC125074242 [Vanessa atalanta]|uniref:uncharacterized protein LOC125074242 n=1 Tax=Vanessa atalanta TaxID=42275 RepID=UPI001FCDDA34|nr:uncharacterized protein LOC125074242 [Vanessa atalanta]
MSFDVSWEVDKYKEEHESDEHWLLRKAFMERWKNDYPEERLVCLAQVFGNIEFMGCRYPTEVMKEVARMSYDVTQQYRKSKKTKLQRTFVSASDAAEDRARGVKREGGVIKNGPNSKNIKILFVPQTKDDAVPVPNIEEAITENINNDNENTPECNDNDLPIVDETKTDKKSDHSDEYMNEMLALKCLDVSRFSDKMFDTEFGKMVLLIRPWAGKLSNIQSSCQACHLPIITTYKDNCFSLFIKGILVAQATGLKVEAKSVVETMAWNRLREQMVSVIIKELWLAQGDRVSVGDVSKVREFGKPVETSVAVKMMKLMGWKGGGLGADAQGIEEPIKPHLQMVNRAGLGCNVNIQQLRRAGQQLMTRFIASDAIDVDLVFSNEFSKEERAVLHHTAQRIGLASKSYGGDAERFLVVKKKLDPFSIVRAVIAKGGNTPKYQVFLPISLGQKR